MRAPERKTIPSPLAEQEENELFRIRLSKLQELHTIGIIPYPSSFEQTHLSREILNNTDLLGQTVSVAGRLISIRRMGKVNFAHIQDQEGRLQIFLQAGRVGEKLLLFFNHFFDPGDIVGIRGEVFQTKTGETTVAVDSLQLLSKALRPPPSKFHGLRDQEVIYRQRYLDLLVNPESRERFEVRRRIIKIIRSFLDSHDFKEVETPTLQSEVSGATARPFVTHHNALDMDLYLRIAPETYLKRLLVGGYERVYEIGKNFRNEGVDASHLQDFTMLEFYAAYWDASRNLAFTQALMKEIIAQAVNRTVLRTGGVEIDLSGEWPVRKYRDAILEHSGIDIYTVDDEGSLCAQLRERGIKIDGAETMNLGQLVDKLFKVSTRPKLIKPQFLTEYPAVLSPLARSLDHMPGYVDQFQLLIGGWEVAKGYSELVDPLEQRVRLIDQVKLRELGDEEAMPLDEDYLRAMEYGMPPNSGVGMGIDRLSAILSETDNLRDVIFFPLTRKT